MTVIKRNLLLAVSFAVMIGLSILALNLKAAGQLRYARFNIDMLGLIFDSYHKRYDAYPENLNKLPKFYVVYALEGLSCNPKMFAEGKFRGYRYDASVMGKNKFVISASPFGFWPAKEEFGITENGALKSNDIQVDILADSYDEVDRWKAIKRLEKIRMQ